MAGIAAQKITTAIPPVIESTVIYLVYVSNLFEILAARFSDPAITLVIFDNFGSAGDHHPYDFEITMCLLRHRPDIRVVALTYSAEAFPTLADHLNVCPTLRDALRCDSFQSPVLEIVSCGQEKAMDGQAALDCALVDQLDVLLDSGDQILVLVNTKSGCQQVAKCIRETFTWLVTSETVAAADRIVDRALKLSAATGVAILNGYAEKADQEVLQSMITSKLLKIIVGMPLYSKAFMEIGRIILRDASLFPQNISGLISKTPLIVITSDESKTGLDNAFACRGSISIDITKNLPHFLLMLLRRKFASTAEDLRREFSETLHFRLNGGVIDEALEILLESELIRSDCSPTEIGIMCEKTRVSCATIRTFRSVDPPNSLSDAFVILCREVISPDFQVLEREMPLLKTMANDPSIEFPSLIPLYQSTFSPIEKTMILVQYSMIRSVEINDPQLQKESSELFLSLRSLSLCLKQMMDHRSAFNGMIWSRALVKAVHWRMWPTTARRLGTQLPQIGPVYSEKLFTSGIQTVSQMLAMTPQEWKQVLGRASDSICQGIKVIPKYHLSLEKKARLIRVMVRNIGGFEPDAKSGIVPAYDIIVGIPETNEVLFHKTITEWPADKTVIAEFHLPPGVDFRAAIVHGIDSRFIGVDSTVRLFSDSNSGFGGSSNGDPIEEVEHILLKRGKDYKNLDEVSRDLLVLERAEMSLRCQGKLSQVSAIGMTWKRTELKVLQDINCIRNIIACICVFLTEKEKEYPERSEYIREIERIYHDQGASDTKEAAFYENITFLGEISEGRLYGSISRELAKINKLLEGVSFWREA
jgi:hypothetical protein